MGGFGGLPQNTDLLNSTNMNYGNSIIFLHQLSFDISHCTHYMKFLVFMSTLILYVTTAVSTIFNIFSMPEFKFWIKKNTKTKDIIYSIKTK